MEKSLQELIERRLTQYEVGSVQHDHYMQMKRELESKTVKIHVAEEALCGGCQ